jgi:hypothetical protein
LTSLSLALSSCATAPLPKGEREGQREKQWHGSFAIKDKQNNKSNNLVMDALSREPNQLRLEITTQLGIPIASIVMNNNRLQALLPQQKRFIDAPATAQAMGKIARVPIEPAVLMDLLFDTGLNERKGWSCDNNSEQRCVHAASSASVVWRKREGSPRQFLLDSPRAEGNFSIREVTTKVEFNESTFNLNPPASYKFEKL